MADDEVVAALRAEHRRFFDYEHQCIRAEIATYEACPACSSTSSRQEFSKDWFTIDRCRECGMVWTNPRLNDETLADFYNGPYTSAYNETKFFNQTRRQADIVSTDARRFLTGAAPYQPSGRFLEIGPGGEGTMMAAAIAAGYDVTGVELTMDCVDALRRRFGDAATVIHSDLEHGLRPVIAYRPL
jgi:hypothetical protein